MHASPYAERLRPAPWLFVATALVIPASLLVFLPISVLAGVVVAIVLYGGVVAVLVLTSPVIEVADGRLRAGPASIDVDQLGDPEGFRGAEATAERGVRLHARAHLVIRGWVDPVVRVPLLDPTDPAPYWLLSTRDPERLIAAIRGSRRS
ncbi:DUF3093 domain-containing protein [Clavibacter tessellarius]|uniref:DUF3093 domain-containing protein n=1 Tax=Clavibacter tessellarius TaxID=31965 RepID=A0A225CB17_9MICO|nr:DUF3093 domain-containing protein [Clavibacter michiganensis]OQJ63719.1 hypothetical protein B5P24_12310 [Clavibacter michiganensis subsp. tessellarius]UKF33302.1 DUF3093 domain-containing protein [Clavibacter michiganensis subsp. tessellarius]